VIGELIKHYRIQEVVGSGGMGVVYRALDVNLERTVAVKVVGAEFRADPEFVERFRQEARVQAALNHPSRSHQPSTTRTFRRRQSRPSCERSQKIRPSGLLPPKNSYRPCRI
jgi:serine/threonine protein kinase